MAVNLIESQEAYSIQGVRLATASAGIRYQDRDDLVLIEIDERAQTAAVFTKNKFCAAPVTLSKKNLREAAPRYLVINAGNANAGTGQLGMDAALTSTQLICEEMKVAANQVLPFSTGVIGEVLDTDKIKHQLPMLVDNLSEQNWLQAAKAIMTTDTVSKAYSEKITIANRDIYITGISKGSGMIQPNMATMLAFIATDIEISKQSLQNLLQESVDQSFNAITVDSDTSTNDACVLIATGKSGLNYDSVSSADKKLFIEALGSLMKQLAQAIVRDGEGATKFVSVNVKSVANIELAKKVAYSVANSPLVKTALSASDPNWGRIMAAVGKCDETELNLSKASLFINGVEVMSQGEISASYTEAMGKQAMSNSEIDIVIELNAGSSQHTVWTTDLTHEYVSINADYRS